MELIEMVQAYKGRTYDEDILGVQNHDGVDGISNKLKVKLEKGLDGSDFPARTEFFGNNYNEPLKAKSFCKIYLEALDDFMLKVLIVAATASLIFGYIGADPEDYGHVWSESVAIYVAVIIVSGVSAFVDWRKEKEFVKRSQSEEDSKFVNVIRDGKTESVHINFLHVGDVIMLKYGMVVPVDGIVIKCNQLTTNEAAMTGESDERRKETLETCLDRKAEKGELDGGKPNKADAHILPSPIMLSGTSVASGEGEMLTIMVGENSALGEIMKKLEVRPQETPLQMKLEVIATEIGKLGTYAALLTIHVLLFRYFLDGFQKRNVDLFGGESEGETGLFAKNFKLWVDNFIIGVAVIVVAVPEGLPLAVMISLAYSQSKMLEDNNYVKKLQACEIMGGASNICSDKTGTLTLNQMKVARVWVGKDVKLDITQDEKTKKMLPIDPLSYFTKTHWDFISQSIACNVPEDFGATDKGMVDLLERGSVDMDEVKAKHNVGDKQSKVRFPFSSKRKRMSTVIENATGAGGYDKRLCIKGASEIILRECSHYIDEAGERREMTDIMKSEIEAIIIQYAKDALRTIALGYVDLEPGYGGQNHDEPLDDDVKTVELKNLTLIGILGIMDVIRSEVPHAVDVCRGAGVTVRMVTGDNIITAQAIAEMCKIITKEEIGDPNVCKEGPEFYAEMGGLIATDDGREQVRNFSEFKKLMRTMKVMARSRPEDKYLMVTGLMQMGEVVAVTGDGTNDAPALAKADVGFGMGITGTDVCKAAADIIIQDDSFTSVVKACSWGRNVFDNIKRFLQFQLTVNVNALITTVVGSVIMKYSPLQAIQLLWVNMIMDSLASLALATEMPKPHLLKRPPQNRDDFVVSRKMTKHILYMSLFQMVILFIFIFAGENIIPEPVEALRYNNLRPEIGQPVNEYVLVGRAYTLTGEKYYLKIKDEAGDQDSRHFTFIFNLFVWLQIVNMICSRKIHDEKNIFSGLCENPMFILVFIIIVIGHFCIIQFTGHFFKLHTQGQHWIQHLWAIGISVVTVFFWNFFLKLLPDSVAPKLGKDSVDDRARAERAAAAGQ